MTTPSPPPRDVAPGPPRRHQRPGRHPRRPRLRRPTRSSPSAASTRGRRSSSARPMPRTSRTSSGSPATTTSSSRCAAAATRARATARRPRHRPRPARPRTLEIDVEGRTAWAGSGLTAGDYTTAAAEHGLATGFGDTGSVGLGGITTGGGIGYLVRKFGMTIDSLLAAELVTADGRIRLVDARHDPDLFWAIRGGGGNLGVVTRFQFRLHEVPSVVGGMLILPATPAVIAGYMAAAEAAPEELSSIANVMPCPPMPFVPEEHHGEVVVFALMAFAGPTRRRRARPRPVPRARDAAGGPAPSDALPGDVPARGRSLPPDRGGDDPVPGRGRSTRPRR